MNLIIQAANVHQGGGKALLLPLLKAARRRASVVTLLDERLTLRDGPISGIAEIRVRPSILGRLVGEWKLRSLAKEGDTVLCFGNVPPLFKTRARVVVFLQNRYLIEKVGLRGFSVVAKLRIFTERLWLSWRVKHAHKVFVQTPSMQRQVQVFLGRSAEVISFVDRADDESDRPIQKSIGNPATYDFVYVASGEPHKNHARLIEGWRILAAEGLFPSLCLTVQERQHPGVVDYIARAKTDDGLRIENVNASSTAEIEALYQRSRAVVYPSTLESFGLPLIEARRADLPIIAAELDYVRDIVDPVETFDPYSPLSIARAVKRFLKVSERPLQLINGDSFVEQVLAG